MVLDSERAEGYSSLRQTSRQARLTIGVVLGLLQLCLGQFQVKVQLDLLFLQVSKASSKITRFLQSGRGSYFTAKTIKTINTKTTVDCPQSTIASGTTPSGCTLCAPAGSDPTRPVRRSRVQGVKKRGERKKNSDHSRLPAVDRGLGDYTQWVHLACPHRF